MAKLTIQDVEIIAILAVVGAFGYVVYKTVKGVEGLFTPGADANTPVRDFSDTYRDPDTRIQEYVPGNFGYHPSQPPYSVN